MYYVRCQQKLLTQRGGGQKKQALEGDSHICIDIILNWWVVKWQAFWLNAHQNFSIGNELAKFMERHHFNVIDLISRIAFYLSLNVEFSACPNLFYINSSNTQTMVNIVPIIFQCRITQTNFMQLYQFKCQIDLIKGALFYLSSLSFSSVPAHPFLN